MPRRRPVRTVPAGRQLPLRRYTPRHRAPSSARSSVPEPVSSRWTSPDACSTRPPARGAQCAFPHAPSIPTRLIKSHCAARPRGTVAAADLPPLANQAAPGFVEDVPDAQHPCLARTDATNRALPWPCQLRSARRWRALRPLHQRQSTPRTRLAELSRRGASGRCDPHRLAHTGRLRLLVTTPLPASRMRPSERRGHYRCAHRLAKHM